MGSQCARHGGPSPLTRIGSPEPAERRRWKKVLLNPEGEALSGTQQRRFLDPDLADPRRGKGKPLSAALTPGQRHGSTQLEGLLDAVLQCAYRVRMARLVDPAKAPLTYSPTKDTAPKAVEDRYIDVASPILSPSARTTRSVAPGNRDADPVSTEKPTADATWPRGA